jgi:hypothetical protein
MRAKIPKGMKDMSVDIDSITVDPDNARHRDEDAIVALMSSLKRFGQRRPVVVRAEDRVVMAGNGRLVAARRLGWKRIAAVITDDDPATAAAYAIADNRSADLASWDNEALQRQLETLSGEGSLEGVGFTDEDLARLMADASDVSFIDADPDATYADGSRDEDMLDPEPTTDIDDDGPLESNVRMVQIFLSPEEYDRFTGAVLALGVVFDTTNTTETVLAAVLREAHDDS